MNSARVALAALALPVLAGIAWMAAAGAPAHYLGINAGALLVAALWIGFGWSARSLSQRRGLTLALLAILFLPLVLGPHVNGIARWIAIGPFALHTGMLVGPALAILASRDPDYAVPILLTGLFAALLQPDAATGFALTFAAIGAHDATKDWKIGLVGIVGFIASLRMFVIGELPATPFVERVLIDALALSPWAALALFLSLAASFALILFAGPADKPQRLALAGAFFGFSMAALMSHYPTILIGYGAAPILGLGFALALLHAESEAATSEQ
ncbi:hypothetical protein [Altererythrobacter xiamenensis]|nr:hypothetical protein [Altererythrobacter xiamenensis]